MAYQLQRVQKLLATERHTYDWPTILLTDNTVWTDWRFASIDSRVRAQHILDVMTQGNPPQDRLEEVLLEKHMLEQAISALKGEIVEEKRRSNALEIEIESIRQEKLEQIVADLEANIDKEKKTRSLFDRSKKSKTPSNVSETKKDSASANGGKVAVRKSKSPKPGSSEDEGSSGKSDRNITRKVHSNDSISKESSVEVKKKKDSASLKGFRESKDATSRSFSGRKTPSADSRKEPTIREEEEYISLSNEEKAKVQKLQSMQQKDDTYDTQVIGAERETFDVHGRRVDEFGNAVDEAGRRLDTSNIKLEEDSKKSDQSIQKVEELSEKLTLIDDEPPSSESAKVIREQDESSAEKGNKSATSRSERPQSAPPGTLFYEEFFRDVTNDQPIRWSEITFEEYPLTLDSYLKFKEEMEVLKEHLKNLESEILIHRNHSKKLEHELDILTEELKAKVKEAEEAKNATVFTSESLKNLQKEIAEKEGLHAEGSSEEIQGLREELRKREDEIKLAERYARELKDKIEQLKLALDLKTEELDTERASRASLELEIKKYSKTLKETEKVIEVEKKTSARLEKELESVRAQLDQHGVVFEESSETSEDGLSVKIRKLEELEHLLQLKEKEKEQLEKVLENSEERYLGARCDLQDLHAKYESALSELNTKREELLKLREKCAEVPILVEELKNLHCEVQSLTANNAYMTELREELLIMQEQLKEMPAKDEEIKNLKNALEACNVLRPGNCDHSVECLKKREELKLLRKCIQNQLIPLLKELEMVKKKILNFKVNDCDRDQLEEELAILRIRVHQMEEIELRRDTIPKCCDVCDNKDCLIRDEKIKTLEQYTKKVIPEMEKEMDDLRKKLQNCESSHQNQEELCKILQNQIDKLQDGLKSKEDEIEKLRKEMEKSGEISEQCEMCQSLKEQIEELRAKQRRDDSETSSIYGTPSVGESDDDENFQDCDSSIPSRGAGDGSTIPQLLVAHARLPDLSQYFANAPVNFEQVLDHLKLKLEQCQSEKNLLKERKQRELEDWKQRHENLKKELNAIKSEETANQRKYGKKVKELQKVVLKYQIMKHKYEDLLLEEEKRRAEAEERLLAKYGSKTSCVCRQLGLGQLDDTPLDLVQLLVTIIHSGIKLLSVKTLVNVQAESKKSNNMKCISP